MNCTIKPQTIYASSGLRLKFERNAIGSCALEIEDATGCRRILFTPEGEVLRIVPLTPQCRAGT